LRDDVKRLAELIGLPRANAQLGVVQFENAFFHPKVCHLRRNDGSQCAYVGSANFTGQGVAALHIEAGLLLDTRDGDSDRVLNTIASAIDDWFTPNREGVHNVRNLADVDRLVNEGVLIVTPPRHMPVSSSPDLDAASSTNVITGSAQRARLRPLMILPSLPDLDANPSAPAAGTIAVQSTATAIVSANRSNFPIHVLFDPNSVGPTRGVNALTGSTLPGNAAGLIVRLTRDDTRIFARREGTANVNLPVETMGTLRFGVLGRGIFPDRPRAEFDLFVRYIGMHNTFVLPNPIDTNVMLYGYIPGETGHQNRRMLLPSGIGPLRDQILHAGDSLPTEGDFAFLEWPIVSSPEFRLSFLERGSQIANDAHQIFTGASNNGQLVGGGACWLPISASTIW